MSTVRPLLATLSALTVLTGLAYPLSVTGVGQLLFPRRARGSLLVRSGRVVGSEFIGQFTEEPKYFWGRLSATGGFQTHAANSGGSNLAPSNPALKEAAVRRINALRAADPEASGPVPVDLVTASGSGLDPHITPAAARFQARRVARARGIPEAAVQELVRRHTEGRTFGILGEPRVSVLALNLALDEVGE